MYTILAIIYAIFFNKKAYFPLLLACKTYTKIIGNPLSLVPEIPLKIGNCKNHLAASLYYKSHAIWNLCPFSSTFHQEHTVTSSVGDLVALVTI